MARNYELVCVIHSTLGSKDIDALKASIEKEIPVLLATDDMGLMATAYPLAGQDQAYYVSYHMQAEGDQITQMKQALRLMKGLAKFVFFGMKDNESFLMYADLKKSYDAIVEEEDARKQSTQKVEEDKVEEDKVDEEDKEEEQEE